MENFKKIAMIAATLGVGEKAVAQTALNSKDKKIEPITHTIKAEEKKKDSKPVVNWFSREKSDTSMDIKDKNGNVIINPNTGLPLQKEVVVTVVPDSKLSKGFTKTETTTEKLKKIHASGAIEGNLNVNISNQEKLSEDKISEDEMSLLGLHDGKNDLLQSSKSLNLEYTMPDKNNGLLFKAKGSIGMDNYNTYSSEQKRVPIPGVSGGTTGVYEATPTGNENKPFGSVGVSMEGTEDPNKAVHLNLKAGIGFEVKDDLKYVSLGVNPSVKFDIKNKKNNFGNVEVGADFKAPLVSDMTFEDSAERNILRDGVLNANLYAKLKTKLSQRLSAEFGVKKEAIGDTYGTVGLSYKIGGKDKQAAKIELLKKKTIKIKPNL